MGMTVGTEAMSSCEKNPVASWNRKRQRIWTVHKRRLVTLNKGSEGRLKRVYGHIKETPEEINMTLRGEGSTGVRGVNNNKEKRRNKKKFRE